MQKLVEYTKTTMLKNYILIAIRNILRNKAISFINIFGLSVSMSVCLLLIIIVTDQMSYDEFNTDQHRVYRVITDRVEQKEYEWSTATSTFPLSNGIKEHTAVEKMAVIKRRFSGVGKWEQQEIPFKGYYSNNDFFEIFDLPLAKGNMADALTLPNAIVLTEKLADKIFGEKDPLNETLMVEGIGDFVVTGVFEPFPGKTHLDFEALVSINYLSKLTQTDSSQNSVLDDWNNIYDTYIYIQIKEGANVASLNPLLAKAAIDNYDPEGKFEYEFKLQSLADITPGPLLSNNTGFGLPDFMVYIMLGLALVVLSSACFNYANLTTARAVNRAKEIGVRKVVGARRKHIFSQFMIEAVIIAVIAFIFADLIAQYLLPQMNSFFANLGAPMSFDQAPGIYWWFIGFVILAGLAAGLVPALFFSGTSPLAALKKAIQLGRFNKKSGFRRFDVRKVLVVVQFAFTIFFVITIVTIYQQTRFVMTTDHGFETQGIVNVRLQGLDYEKIKTEFEKLANVKLVASTSHLPALGTNNTVDVHLKDEEEPVFLSYFAVGHNYIETMGVKLLAGTDFPAVMPEQERFIILNQQAVNRFDLGSPEAAIGQLLTVGENELEVIGVVEDFHYERLDEEIGPMALRYKLDLVQSAVVVINTEQVEASVAGLEAIWKEQTNRPFEYTFYEDDFRLSYGHYEALLLILGYVTIITVSIACLGLLGMVIYHIQNKTKEIGIRKALGAEGREILIHVSKGFLILIVIAYAI
ncbi:MAG: ABC transporter permease, partial [Fulvivirga sp.]